VPEFPLVPKTPIWSIYVVNVYLYVDFGVNGDLRLTGSITPRAGGAGQFTGVFQPEITLAVDAGMPIELLVDVADVTPYIELEPGVGFPFTYQDLPGGFTDVGACFSVSAELKVHVYIWKVMDHTYSIAGPYEFDTPDGCHFSFVPPTFAVTERASAHDDARLEASATLVHAAAASSDQAGDQAEDGVPRTSVPVVTLDRTGNGLLLWPEYGGRPGRVISPAVLFQQLFPGAASRNNWVAAPAEGGFDPAVAFMGPNRALAAWTHIPSGDEMEPTRLQVQAALDREDFEEVTRLLRQTVNLQEIYTASWNGEGWSQPTNLTGDGLADAAPALAADPATGRAVLAWVKDRSTQADPRGQQLAIYASHWDGRAWSAPRELSISNGQNYAPAVAYRDGKALVVWVEDLDGDLRTTQDARLMMASFSSDQWQSPGLIPGAPSGAAMPSVGLDRSGNPLVAFTVLQAGAHAEATGVPHALYLRGGQPDLARIGGGALGEEPRVVITDDNEALVFYRPVGLSPSDGASPRRRVPTSYRGVGWPDPLHPSANLAAVGALLGEGTLRWGSPRVVAEQATANWTGFGVATDGREVVLAMADAFGTPVMTTSPAIQTLASDRLRTLRVRYTPLPVVNALTFSDTQARAGAPVTVQADVVNLGLAPLREGASVAFYRDVPGDPERRIGTAPLRPAAFGEHQTVSATFTSDGEQHVVFAVATNAGQTLAPDAFDVAGVVNALPAPTNLRVGASPVGSGVLLNWNAADAPAVARFGVWRSPALSGPFERVGTARVPAYLDESAPPDRLSFYQVTAENTAGQRSEGSNIAAAEPGGP
jgi:hypothetical protein